jgi:hypothetical protein
MQHSILSRATQYNGAFTDLFLLGTKRVRSNAAPFTISSDFTAAATTQTITLLTLAVGDCVVFPLAQGWVKQKFTDSTEDAAAVTLANLKVDIGITGTTTKFIAGVNADLQQAVNSPITAPVAASTAHAALASVAVLATFTSTAGNMSTITFGDLWIYMAIARMQDHVRDISA